MVPDFYADPNIEGRYWTADTRAEAYSYIYEQIKTHESIIRYYKKHHNALTDTCRIPPEILAVIFGEVVRLAQEINRHNPWDHGIQISWVGNLWSDIPIDYPDWVRETVQRSKMTPLTISYRTTHPSAFARTTSNSISSSFMKEILSTHLSRIRSITLGSTHYAISVVQHTELLEILALLDQPAPALEHLKASPSLDGGDNSEYKLPDGIGVGSPQLKHLILEGCGVAWKPFGFRNLKTLKISNIPPSMTLSMSELLDVLSQTPLLETLSIADIEHSAGAGGAQPINLGHLRRIAVSSRLVGSVFFFDHIVFSKSARAINIKLDIPEYLLYEEDVLTLVALVRNVEKSVSGSISKLKLGDKVRIWKSETTQTLPALLTTAIIVVEPNKRFAAGLSNTFWQSFHLSQLLSLDVDINLAADTWSLYGDLPHLKYLKVSSNRAHLLNVLCRGMVQASNLEDSTLRPSFVALRSLAITRWDLMIADSAEEDIATGILDCFKLRKKAGLCLQLLELRDCRVSNATVDGLRDYVKKVTWDGYQNESDSDSDSYN
ncbi:hypothetical protein DXG01_005861 [Tephrocybe rancida]|nr:hypothetical protein DXG01_005861 [Tephrocybe rancida]